MINTKKKFKKIKNIKPLLEKKLMNLNRQFLHVKIIGFIHPKKKERDGFQLNFATRAWDNFKNVKKYW